MDDTNNILAKLIAKGIVDTGIEGAYDSVSQSTSYDYPSLGVQQLEGERADELLSMIDGGDRFMMRSYRDIVETGELYALKTLLCTERGIEAQNRILIRDCLGYVEALQTIPTLDDTRVAIFCGMWCPTSTYVVQRFLKQYESQVNLRSLYDVYKLFEDYYWIAADVDKCYKYGYANRARNTYEYVADLDLTEYGIENYGEE